MYCYSYGTRHAWYAVLMSIVFHCLSCYSNLRLAPERKSERSSGRNDAWTILGAGGGGAMFYQTVSPHDPDFVFASSDMTGSFVTYNGGKSWRMFNLHGVVRFYAFDPVDPNTVYANSIGLFRSSDRGNSWELVFPRPENVQGVVSKGDHADEWLVTRDRSSRRVTTLTIDPVDSKKLYAGVSEDGVAALYASTDAGKHWALERKLDNEAKHIFIDPASPAQNRTIYIAGSGGILVKAGGQWKMNSAPKGVRMLTTFTGGYDSREKSFVIYAMSGKSYFNQAGDPLGIYITTDAGATWENRQDGLLAYASPGSVLPEWRTIATSAAHPNTLYVSYNDFRLTNDSIAFGVAKSEDYGKTWRLSWKDIKLRNRYITSENMKDGWLDERFDANWGENPFSIGVSFTNPDIAFCGDFGRTIKTSDGGKTWEQAYTNRIEGAGWRSRGLDVNTTYTILRDPFDSNHIFIPTTDIGLMESFDGMKSWSSATHNNGVPPDWVNTTYWMVFDPQQKGKAWAVMSDYHDLPRPKMFKGNDVESYGGGILVSENSGKTWRPVSEGIGKAAMTHILLDPASPNKARTLFACAFGKGVYKSTDGGKTWALKNNGIDGTQPFAWRIERRDQDGALFLVVSRRSEDGSIGNSYDGAIYVSFDGAENWTKLRLPVETNGPTSLIPDPRQHGKLLLSAWGRPVAGKFSPDIGGGIFISEDDGKTWKQTLSIDQHIGAVSFDKRNNRFYACGFNGSAYYSENGGSAWSRIKGYNFKWGQRVEPDPEDPEKIFVITYGGGVWHGPALGDPEAPEDIATPLKREW